MATMERHYKVREVAELLGYQEATIRKKILRREIGFRKTGRLVAIPESEVLRLRGPYSAPVVLDARRVTGL